MSTPKTFTPIHPFPARMDPVAAMDGLVPSGGRKLTVLDSMMGSGSVPALAALRGHVGYGFDLDPLALVLARALVQPPDDRFLVAARQVQQEARRTEGRTAIAMDDETWSFVDYWFDPQAQDRLAALAIAIESHDDDLQPKLWCAFSRLIITKDAGASRARDVSHSRPHVVRDKAVIDPIERFVTSAELVSVRHRAVHSLASRPGTTHLASGDAKDLPLPDCSVDRVATSPPYLQAIDYLRGHRMTLVWMGHSVGSLRELRARSIGAERSLASADNIESIMTKVAPDCMSARATGILRRYVSDLNGVVAEIARVLKPSGRARFVVADATLVGQSISIEKIIRLLATKHGLSRVERQVRALATGRRYLPPPGATTGALDRRIRVEQLLTFART
jgi:SAM-dependent methyltransferase